MRRWPFLVVALAALVFLGVAVYSFREATRRIKEAVDARAEAQQWKSRAESAERQVAELRGEQEEQPHEHEAVKPREQQPKDDVATRQELVKLLSEKDDKLASLTKDYEHVSTQVRDLEEKLEASTRETQRLASSEKDAREQLDTAKRLAEALQTEMQGKSVRSGQLETNNQQLRQREQEAKQRIERLVKLSEQMDDLNRRRDVYLSNILRRYRDVTDLYRTLNLQFSNPRDGVSPASNDLSRLQNAIYQAEDELRQLQSLNQQALRLQKDITAARK